MSRVGLSAQQTDSFQVGDDSLHALGRDELMLRDLADVRENLLFTEVLLTN